jgi:integrase
MTGTIVKRPNRAGRARWAYVFDLGKDDSGKRRQLTKSGFESKRQAEVALAKAIVEHREKPATAAEKPMPTFAEFFERWHRDVVTRAHSRKTAERSHELAQYTIRLFGEAPLDQLTSEQLTADVNSLLDHGGRVTKEHPHGRPLSPKTVRHIAFLVQACIQQAVDWDILLRNPMKKVRKPKVPRRRPAVVDRGGFERLLEIAAGLTIYPVIVLAMATGMRRGELLALEWRDLDWERGILEVSKSLEQTKQGLRIKSTKSGATRRFSIPAGAIEVLRQHKREQDEHRSLYGADYAGRNLIFARRDGEYYSPDKMGTRIRAAMKRAGLMGVSLHSLRHSHASELLSKGAPITAVSERLGHASPNITLSIYSHALPSDNEAAAKLWNDAMSDVLEASRKKAFVRKCGKLANVSEDSEKIRVIPLKSAS